MKDSRLEILKEFSKKNPEDPFNHYALALEYLKIDKSKSLVIFEKLIIDFKNYVPTYYHLAALYQSLEQTSKAIETYEKGIEVARTEKDHHALRELQSAYQELMFED